MKCEQCGEEYPCHGVLWGTHTYKGGGGNTPEAQHTPEVQQLIADAAEAEELFSGDELEEYAKAKGRSRFN